VENKKMFKKAIVTGGAGFIGSHLVDALISLGVEVSIIDNLSTGKKENINSKANFYNLDIQNLEEIKPIFKNVDVVFHLAAIASVQYSIENPKETNDINVEGTLNVLLSAKEAGVKRFIFSSSSSVYGDVDKIPTDESCKIAPKSPYALHKYTGELYCKLFSEIYNLKTVCLRYFNVYGPRQNPNGAYASVIAKFSDLKRSKEVLTITGDGEQTRDFVFVEDVAMANIFAAKSDRVGKGEVINIGSGKKYSVNEIAKIIGGATKNIPPRVEPKDSLADIKLAKFLLDWEPQTSLEDGLRILLSGSEF
jgi:UDP-glucose 4-epimerase